MFKFIEQAGKIPGSFKTTFILVITLLVFGIKSPEKFAGITKIVNIFLFQHFGVFYLVFALLALILLVIIGASPLGKIKIGGKDAKPQFGYLSWLSMLFCTGMGVGLMFWGVAEPLYYITNPPLADTQNHYEQQIAALKLSMFHWGLTPWAIYGLTAVAVSFLGFNMKRGILFSSMITGKTKNMQNRGPAVSFIDIVTIVAIFFGIVSSFGMGVLLLEGGLEALGNFNSSFGIQVLIIIFATVFYMTSTLRGLDRGIKVLSNISMSLSIVLFCFVLWNIPKDQLYSYTIDTVYIYAKDFINMSLGVLNYTNTDFLREWTVKYWSWWIAWAPFVGIFIAITSYGRSIREMAFSVLLAPSIYSFIWFIIFGTAAFYTQEMTEIQVSLGNASIMLFDVIGFITKIPFISWLALFIAAIFFINSADSATYTLASFTKEKRHLTEKPSKFLQISWGIMFSVMTGLFLSIGGIYILQEITLIFALPFTLLLLITFMVFIRLLIKYYKQNFLTDRTFNDFENINASE